MKLSNALILLPLVILIATGFIWTGYMENQYICAGNVGCVTNQSLPFPENDPLFYVMTGDPMGMFGSIAHVLTVPSSYTIQLPWYRITSGYMLWGNFSYPYVESWNTWFYWPWLPTFSTPGTWYWLWWPSFSQGSTYLGFGQFDFISGLSWTTGYLWNGWTYDFCDAISGGLYQCPITVPNSGSVTYPTGTSSTTYCANNSCKLFLPAIGNQCANNACPLPTINVGNGCANDVCPVPGAVFAWSTPFDVTIPTGIVSDTLNYAVPQAVLYWVGLIVGFFMVLFGLGITVSVLDNELSTNAYGSRTLTIIGSGVLLWVFLTLFLGAGLATIPDWGGIIVGFMGLSFVLGLYLTITEGGSAL